MSGKGNCGKHAHGRKKLYQRLLAAILAFIILVLFVIFIIWAVLRPTKPRFSLQDATVYQFNSTSPNTLTTTLQISVRSHNPNDRIGIYYNRLRVFASYHYQQITLPTLLPPTYQGHDDVNVWSPFLYGVSVPVGPYLSGALVQDQAAGFVMLTIRVDGHLKWKVGTWVSGHYHIHVSCPAYVNYAGGNSGAGEIFHLQQPVGCNTDV